jgi:hypothetical protein
LSRERQSLADQKRARKKLKTDPLAKLAKAMETLRCVHPNLKFERYGAALRCIDCKSRWFKSAGDDYDLPDYRYGNASIEADPTRHSRFEVPRTEPKDDTK